MGSVKVDVESLQPRHGWLPMFLSGLLSHLLSSFHDFTSVVDGDRQKRKARIGIKRLGAVANKMRKQSSMNRAVRPRWLKCVSCCRWRVFQDTIKPFRTTVLVSVLLLKDKLRLQLTSRKAKSREL